MPLPFDLRMRLENPEEDWICFWKFWRLVKSGYYGRSRSSGEGWSQARSSEFSRTAAGLEVVEARVPRREPPVSQCSPTYSLSPLTGIELAWRQFSSVQFSSPPERLVRAVQVADVLPRCCPAARKPPASTLSGVKELKGRWDRCPPPFRAGGNSPGQSKLILARSDALGPQIH